MITVQTKKKNVFGILGFVLTLVGLVLIMNGIMILNPLSFMNMLLVLPSALGGVFSFIGVFKAPRRFAIAGWNSKLILHNKFRNCLNFAINLSY